MTDSPSGDTRGFRPTTRRRNRLAAGVALGAAAIGGNVLVYSSLDRSEPAIQVVRDVPAGERITSDMLRTVEIDADATVNIVNGADLNTLVGQYAKVRLVSGSLVAPEAVQSGPLVSEGNAVVALQVPEGELPVGVRERVPVRLVTRSSGSAVAGDDTGAMSVDGRVVGLPRVSNNGLGTVSLSVELALADAAIIATADAVRVVLLVPEEDPASTSAARSEGDS